jgi:hypothetical protein
LDIAGNFITELDSNFKTAGYSNSQATIICDGAISSVNAENLNESTDISDLL